MPTRLFLIFNHEITEQQAEDARTSLGVEKIVDLPDDLKALWQNVPAEAPRIRAFLKPVMDWLARHAMAGDHVLVQGDFGACYIMVNYAFNRGLVPVYSTTDRQAAEEKLSDGTVVLKHVFKHVRFRKYGE